MPNSRKAVTFLLGNGFDVGMGLKSQYVDFYRVFTNKKSPYYPKQHTHLGRNKDYLAKKIADDKRRREDHWSYYEKWFGNLTKKNDWKKYLSPDNLLKLNEEFQQNFYSYLKEQETGMFYSLADSEIKQRLSEDLGRTMLTALRTFYDNGYIIEGEDQIRSVLEPGGNKLPIDYQFVCFNYSSVLDQCVASLTASVDAFNAALDAKSEGILTKAREAVASDKTLDLTKSEMDMFLDEEQLESFKNQVHLWTDLRKKWTGQGYEWTGRGCEESLRSLLRDQLAPKKQIINVSVHHGHGELKKPEQTALVMGVNDDRQIGPEFREAANTTRSNRLIKQSIMRNRHMDRQLHTTIERINRSDIIVVYGMSIGDTDKHYWQVLYNWLSGNKDRHLIFYIFDNSFNPFDPGKRNEIIGEYAQKFREMTWSIDDDRKRCVAKDKILYFTEHHCPQKNTCKRRKCTCTSLAQWCQEHMDCDSEKNCPEISCPYHETDCKKWKSIRNRIHFAVHHNIFSHDMVTRNYHPAMMFLLILNGILEENGTGTWYLQNQQIAKLDDVSLSCSRDAAAARAGLKLYYLYTKLMETVGPDRLEDAACKAGITPDTSGELYRTSTEWLKAELTTMQDLGANLTDYWKTAKSFAETLKRKKVCGKGEADKIADFYIKIQRWEQICQTPK